MVALVYANCDDIPSEQLDGQDIDIDLISYSESAVVPEESEYDPSNLDLNLMPGSASTTQICEQFLRPFKDLPPEFHRSVSPTESMRRHLITSLLCDMGDVDVDYQVATDNSSAPTFQVSKSAKSSSPRYTSPISPPFTPTPTKSSGCTSMPSPTWYPSKPPSVNYGYREPLPPAYQSFPIQPPASQLYSNAHTASVWSSANQKQPSQVANQFYSVDYVKDYCVIGTSLASHCLKLSRYFSIVRNAKFFHNPTFYLAMKLGNEIFSSQERWMPYFGDDFSGCLQTFQSQMGFTQNPIYSSSQILEYLVKINVKLHLFCRQLFIELGFTIIWSEVASALVALRLPPQYHMPETFRSSQKNVFAAKSKVHKKRPPLSNRN